jgi:hypothetical protein
MAKSRQLDPAFLQHVSPLGWEHINLTGDYTWHTNKRVAKGWLQTSPESQKLQRSTERQRPDAYRTMDTGDQ